MVLPLSFPGTAEGAVAGIRQFAQTFGKKVIVYVKSEVRECMHVWAQGTLGSPPRCRCMVGWWRVERRGTAPRALQSIRRLDIAKTTTYVDNRIS